jgi:hypothetical protein
MNFTLKHRIKVVMKAETEIITSITASPIKQAVILVITSLNNSDSKKGYGCK